MSKVAVKLPNGTTCHLTSARMRFTARFLKWEIFTRKRYSHPGFELRPTDTVLDVGGNLGVFVLWAAPQVPQGRVVTIEPIPSALSCLRLNVERNGLGNVTVLHAAVGCDGGEVELVTYPSIELLSHGVNIRPHAIARLLSKYLHWAVRVTAPRISLGRIMDEHNLDTVNYLKLDCEGAEFEILQNLEAAYWPRIERIAVEYHEDGPSKKGSDLVEILERQGFDVTTDAIILDHVFKIGAIWARRPV